MYTLFYLTCYRLGLYFEQDVECIFVWNTTSSEIWVILGNNKHGSYFNGWYNIAKFLFCTLIFNILLNMNVPVQTEGVIAREIMSFRLRQLLSSILHCAFIMFSETQLCRCANFLRHNRRIIVSCMYWSWKLMAICRFFYNLWAERLSHYFIFLLSKLKPYY